MMTAGDTSALPAVFCMLANGLLTPARAGLQCNHPAGSCTMRRESTRRGGSSSAASALTTHTTLWSKADTSTWRGLFSFDLLLFFNVFHFSRFDFEFDLI
jgi:hypothetical protein